MATNMICHVEWQSTDLQVSQRFFEGLFGWTFRAFGDSMVVFGLGDSHIGGLSKVDTVEAGASPSIWIEVDDLDEQVARGLQLGGRLSRGKEPVPGVGHSAEIIDPDGNRVGLVQFDR
jgi:hypothetical protein